MKEILKINKPISRKENSIIERCVNENGDIAVTHYDLIKNNNDYSILHCTLETGRTHQIRVHLAYIGHPIIGDTLYGNKSDKITRQALHAYKVSFNHPITKQKVEYVAKIPHDIEVLMYKIASKKIGVKPIFFHKLSKPVSRVLSFKIVIYLLHILLYVSSHQIKKMTSSLSLLFSVLLQMGFT